MGNPVLRYLKRDLAGFRKRPKAGVQVGMPKVPVNPDHLEYLIKDYESIESQLAEAVELLADTRPALPEVDALKALDQSTKEILMGEFDDLVEDWFGNPRAYPALRKLVDAIAKEISDV